MISKEILSLGSALKLNLEVLSINENPIYFSQKVLQKLQKHYRLCELCNLFGHKILFMKASGLGLTQNGKDWFNMGETRQMDALKFYTKTGFLQVDVIMSYYGICLKNIVLL